MHYEAPQEHDIAEQEARLAERLQRIDPRAHWQKPVLRRGRRVSRRRVLVPLLGYALATAMGFTLALLMLGG